MYQVEAYNFSNTVNRSGNPALKNWCEHYKISASFFKDKMLSHWTFVPCVVII